jgi:hypothetical protein
MLRTVALLIAGSLWGVAEAQTIQEYLQLRKKHGITQAVGVAALETFVGQRTVEVRGTVKGSFSANGVTVLYLERYEGDPLSVQSENPPDWLLGNIVSARLLIQAERDQELGEMRARLLGAASDAEVTAHERRKVAKAKAAKPAPPKTGTPRAGKPAPREWNLPAHEAISVYADRIRSINKRLSSAEAFEIAQGILGFSVRYGVDARLIMAMVLAESGFNPNATSRAGAMGLGQLMPGTARGMGITDAYDTNQNLYGTVRLVRGHLEKYGKNGRDGWDSLILALAAYNAGSGAVRRHGGVPPYKETQNYIRKVISLYRSFCGQ